ncbi:MAG: Hsp20/alpha crystallin family protein [Streptococcaceae bacterium]|jgi:HSP20 family protein|nr:Hsp20/alpha crystallin family protein [Streptococcaceae bacterium]
MSNELMNRNNDLLGMHNDRFFNHLARNFFGNDFPSFWNDTSGLLMKTDVTETDEAYQVKIDLPGVPKEKIKIDYADGVLSVSGKQHSESEAKNEAGQVIHSERYLGTYNRSYSLPNVARDDIKATFKHGVLTIDLPKVAKDEKTKEISID